VRPFFEGGQMPLTRRVPKLKGFKPPTRKIFDPVNLSDLARIEAAEIGPDEFRSAGLTGRHAAIKILGSGEIDRAVTVRAHAFSKTAKSKIEAAGGRAEVVPTKERRAK
jgi:large subunit ribosomal protein L15